MAPRKKVYTQKAVTSSISADVKMTVKIKDNYYSVSAHEDRTIPDSSDVELDREWEFLYESLYNACGKEMLEITEQMSIGKKETKRK